MDWELQQSALRFEREQRKRQDEARKRVEREKRVKEAAERRQREIDEAQRVRRLREAAVAEKALLQEEAEISAGGGIRFHVQLVPQLTLEKGDKIALPASALAELESQHALDKGPMFFEISVDSDSGSIDEDMEQSEAGSFKENEGNRIQDRPSSSVDVMAQRQLLTSTEDLGIRRKVTHGGVLEFSAEEGFVGLPHHVWLNLGMNSRGEKAGPPSKVHIRYIRLPRGEFAKLQPDTLDFAELQNHKAILEAKLRNHSTLTVGDTLALEYGGLEYRLKVLELKPELSVSLIETDLEVDVAPATESKANESRVIVPLTFGKAQEGLVEEGKYRYYKFFVDESLAKAVVSAEMDILVTLEMGGWKGEGSTSVRDEADADLYLASQPILYPTQHQHQWSSHDVGTKVIVLSAQDGSKFKGAVQYSLGVYGFRGSSKFKVSVDAKNRKESASRGVLLGGAIEKRTLTEGVADIEQCGNCKQFVPQRTLLLHEAYCRRHNVTCDFPSCGAVLRKEERANHVHCGRCGEAMKAAELRKHETVIHAALKCECGAVMEMEAMVKHRTDTCPLRIILCKFCGGSVHARGEAVNPRDRLHGLTQHESECGSRTAPCEVCRKPIMLKEVDLHMAAVHAHASAQQHQLHQTSSIHGDGAAEVREDSRLQEGKASAEGEDIVSHMGGDTLPKSCRVSCPICGLGLHSERDVNRHIEVFHE